MKTIEFLGEVFVVPGGFSYQVQKKVDGKFVGDPFISEIIFKTEEEAKNKLEERCKQAIAMIQTLADLGIESAEESSEGKVVH